MVLNNKAIIKVIGTILIVSGISSIFFKANDIYSSISTFFTPGLRDSLANIVYLDGSVIFFNLLVPVLAIAAGCGLVRFKGWGWRWALIVSFIMLSANVIKAISFVFIEYLTKNLPMQELPDGIPVVSVINVWPPYIYAALSLLLIIVLIRPAIKKEFSEKGE